VIWIVKTTHLKVLGRGERTCQQKGATFPGIDTDPADLENCGLEDSMD
jgi:hypothetical protein